MKIGIDISVLTDPNKTGIGVYTYQLLKALLKVDKSNEYILFGLAPLKAYENLMGLEFRNYPNVKMKVYKMPAKFFRRVFILWQKLNWPPIEKLAGPIDVFHSFNWYLPPKSKVKLVATVFDLTPLLFPKWHQDRTVQLDKIRLERISKSADKIITISESSKNDFTKFYPQTDVEIIYPAAAQHFIKKIKSNDIKKVMKKYKLSPGYFLSVATLEPRKNISSLIKAFLKTNLVQSLVLVGGMGWKNEELTKLVKKNPERIILTGFVSDDELPILYNQARCLIYPSYYEGFGLPVLEAMNCGTPVICSDISSLPEVGGNAVIYVDPYNLKSIQDALLEISNNPNKSKDLSRKGLMQAKRFSWEKSAKKLLNIYQNI